MHRIWIGSLSFLISLSNTSVAQDIGWPPAPVEKTGQTYSSVYGDDGETRLGTAWPTPRFTANVDQNGDGDCDDAGESCDGTVTDNLTGLMWLRNAGCTAFFAGDVLGTNERVLSEADFAVAYLAQGYCGLADASSAGDWRIPNIRELDSLISFAWTSPALSDTTGTAQHSSGNPFFSVFTSGPYWSFTYNSSAGSGMWQLDFSSAQRIPEAGSAHIWPVRDGPAIFADGFGPGTTQQWSGEVQK